MFTVGINSTCKLTDSDANDVVLDRMAEAGWVHRDISYNNVMLYTPSPNYPATESDDTKSARRGTLIDLDYSGRMHKRKDVIRGSFGGRTVSCNLLLPEDDGVQTYFLGHSSIHGIVNPQ